MLLFPYGSIEHDVYKTTRSQNHRVTIELILVKLCCLISFDVDPQSKTPVFQGTEPLFAPRWYDFATKHRKLQRHSYSCCSSMVVLLATVGGIAAGANPRYSVGKRWDEWLDRPVPAKTTAGAHKFWDWWLSFPYTGKVNLWQSKDIQRIYIKYIYTVYEF